MCMYDCMLTLHGQVSVGSAYSWEGKGSHPLCALWLRGLVNLSGIITYLWFLWALSYSIYSSCGVSRSLSRQGVSQGGG